MALQKVGVRMRRLAFLLITVIAGVGVVFGVGAYFAQSAPAVQAAEVKGTAPGPNGTEVPHAFISMESYPDSMQGFHGADGGAHPDWVTFGPQTSFEVPANSLVTVTVTQYDGGETITNSYFAKVHGTVDNMATLNGEPFNEIPADAVGHTFTLRGIPSPSQPALFVSVPLLMTNEENVGDNGYPVPNIVTFSFYTGGPGLYFWNCEFPCGDGTLANFGGPMSSQGYMAGTFTVR